MIIKKKQLTFSLNKVKEGNERVTPYCKNMVELNKVGQTPINNEVVLVTGENITYIQLKREHTDKYKQ